VVIAAGNFPRTRSVQRAMRGKALALAALTSALVAGCGQEGESRRPESEQEVARVTCGDGRARVLTPLAQAQSDGVHIEVTNETGRAAHFTIERDPDGATAIEAPAGTSSDVVALGPGQWTLSCDPGGAGSGNPATLDVVDGGIWVSTDLSDCALPEALHGDPPRTLTAEEGGIVELARQGLEGLTTLEPGDVIEPAGYPEQREAVFAARRDGKTMATISLSPAGEGRWMEGEVKACAD
jgi:hypothetical protein